MKMDNSYRLSQSKILTFQNYFQNEPDGVICLPRISTIEQEKIVYDLFNMYAVSHRASCG